MIKKAKEDSPPNNPAPQDSEGIEILKLEYSALINLYTHTENAIHSVFNFYLTLLSAITGAMIVLFQINGANLAALFPSITGLLIFIVLVGVITQDSIVNKNVDLSNFTLGLNLLKYRLFRDRPAEMPYIFYLPNSWANVSPIPPKKVHTTDRIHKKLWWLFPLGMHQLFISVINSFALAALVIIITQFLSGNLALTDQLIVGCVFVIVISFEANVIYARLKHRRGIEKFNVASNTEIPWAKPASVKV